MNALDVINCYQDGLLSRGDTASALVRAIERPGEVRMALDLIPPEIWDLFVSVVAGIGDGDGLLTIHAPSTPLNMEVVREIRQELRARGVQDVAIGGCK